MSDYSRHYAILGVTPDTDWKALRARYRRLIGQWHPDRFPSDAPERPLAEERSKQITIAYQALERYRRDQGVLPPMEPARSPDGGSAASPDSGLAQEGPRETAKPAPMDTTERPWLQRAPRRRGAFLALSLLTVGVYGAYWYSDLDVQEGDTTALHTRPAEVVTPEGPKPETPQDSGISGGSTLGEVYAIQGVPTRTQGDTWYYGKSSIRFVQGKVASWNEHPDNPLRIARAQAVEAHDGYFDIGSTKDEVRSIQGAPVTETERVWDYGPSRIYFENNRVVRWETNPLQPLRVPR